jgi:hypothetical protein
MLEDGIPTSAFPTRRNAFIGIEIEKNAPVSLAGKRRGHHVSHRVVAKHSK